MKYKKTKLLLFISLLIVLNVSSLSVLFQTAQAIRSEDDCGCPPWCPCRTDEPGCSCGKDQVLESSCVCGKHHEKQTPPVPQWDWILAQSPTVPLHLDREPVTPMESSLPGWLLVYIHDRPS
ncbi:hypothetical protein ACFLU6_11865 [Acidobacteriota bacterium]